MADTWTLFDRLADRYDEVVPFFTAFAVRLVELLDPPAGTKVLDVGSGRGAIAAALVARGCTVTAVDAAPRMVQLLAAAHPTVDVRVMDIHTWSCPTTGTTSLPAASSSIWSPIPHRCSPSCAVSCARAGRWR